MSSGEPQCDGFSRRLLRERRIAVLLGRPEPGAGLGATVAWSAALTMLSAGLVLLGRWRGLL